jgi:hypothetical protein
MRETARFVSTDLLMKQVKAREGIKREMLDYERKQRLKKASQKKRSESSWQVMSLDNFSVFLIFVWMHV